MHLSIHASPCLTPTPPPHPPTRLVKRLPSLRLPLHLDVLPAGGQQLLHLEHVPGAGIRAGIQDGLRQWEGGRRGVEGTVRCPAVLSVPMPVGRHMRRQDLSKPNEYSPPDTWSNPLYR